MAELTVTRTKEYLILKIPLTAVRRGRVSLSPSAERAIADGLRAYAHGRFTGPFDAKKAISFLRAL